MTKAEIFDTRACALGEGPLWHPERQQLFWFDILGKRLLSQVDGAALDWQFDEHASAAGWIDRDRLLIAFETGLFTFDIASGTRSLLHPLEAENPVTRSNDGRADPCGGFWIGTMGKQAEPEAGAIYRLYQGELRKLFDAVTIPNAICFAPDGTTAYFCDTPQAKIMRQPLDQAGWPVGDAIVFVDLGPEALFPDGAVCDAEGALWNAQWGAGRVARYLPDGRLDHVVHVGGKHSSCPAFGGANFSQLFVTTARQGLHQAGPDEGCLYRADINYTGCPENRVIL